MKGIILAGGTGSRLWPSTISVSKQLLPVYDKPLIYYPLSTLMLAGVRKILIIVNPNQKDQFINLLGDGSALGLEITYAEQYKPEGIAQALVIGEKFLNGDSCLLILGDNIFYGVNFGNNLSNSLPKTGAHVFTYEVSNPEDYGILTIGENREPISIEEKPKYTKSRKAVTGLYFLDSRAPEFAKSIKKSQRGELEITSLLNEYLSIGELSYSDFGRGSAWLDTGNANSLNDASNFVRLIEERTGLKISCIEEIAWRKGWITGEDLAKLSEGMAISPYGRYLRSLEIDEQYRIRRETN